MICKLFAGVLFVSFHTRQISLPGFIFSCFPFPFSACLFFVIRQKSSVHRKSGKSAKTICNGVLFLCAHYPYILHVYKDRRVEWWKMDNEQRFSTFKVFAFRSCYWLLAVPLCLWFLNNFVDAMLNFYENWKSQELPNKLAFFSLLFFFVVFPPLSRSRLYAGESPYPHIHFWIRLTESSEYVFSMKEKENEMERSRERRNYWIANIYSFIVRCTAHCQFGYAWSENCVSSRRWTFAMRQGENIFAWKSVNCLNELNTSSEFAIKLSIFFHC